MASGCVKNIAAVMFWGTYIIAMFQDNHPTEQTSKSGGGGRR